MLSSDFIKPLTNAASIIASKLRQITHSPRYPKEISPSITVDRATTSGEITKITISSYANDTEGIAPLLSKVYELGSGLTGPKRRRYPILPKKPGGLLVFPWETSLNIGSPGFPASIANQMVADRGQEARDRFPEDQEKAFLPGVMHPGVKPRPFIDKAIIETLDDVLEIIGDCAAISVYNSIDVEDEF